MDKIEDRTLRLFQEYSWPGNVRELQNIIEHSLVTSKGEYLNVPESYFVEEAENGKQSTYPSLEDYERKYIEDVLQHTGGVLYGAKGAAKILGMKPSTLQSRLKKLGIEKIKPS